ncbi:MAG: hypothetical protein IT493_12020 [Gammaproteobacteria bacterium]|nr:hypothetical protein [Gammaproteobacteria bacterium]
MATRDHGGWLNQEGNGVLIAWMGLLNGDDGRPISLGDFADFCIQFAGTFGAGGTIVFEGSNDGVSYFTLNDAQAAAISKTAAALEQVVEFPRYVRPRVTAGDGTTNLACHLYTRRARI